jgi:hypothetical protein
MVASQVSPMPFLMFSGLLGIIAAIMFHRGHEKIGVTVVILGFAIMMFVISVSIQ